MSYEVVYNSCYGGFGLSHKARKWLKENGLNCPEDELDGVPRHHPLLVKCVKTLGKEANDDFADLKIKPIKSDFYRVEEYDGSEWVTEPNDVEWINAATDEDGVRLIYCENCTTIRDIIE